MGIEVFADTDSTPFMIAVLDKQIWDRSRDVPELTRRLFNEIWRAGTLSPEDAQAFVRYTLCDGQKIWELFVERQRERSGYDLEAFVWEIVDGKIPELRPE